VEALQEGPAGGQGEGQGQPTAAAAAADPQCSQLGGAGLRRSNWRSGLQSSHAAIKPPSHHQIETPCFLSPSFICAIG